jgi:hypothetical protein
MVLADPLSLPSLLSRMTYGARGAAGTLNTNTGA